MMKKLIVIMLLLILSVTVAAGAVIIESPWTLTQHFGGGGVGMFYSLVKDDTLILVDGGYTANAESVRAVIEENGGYVDYWFLTHYHDDHCDAFNTLWPEYKDRIGIVYVTPLSWEDFEPHCQEWDSPESFRTFLDQTEGYENIVPLKRGDKFEIDGLQVNVFNAWDEEILKYSTDVANNCSLVFRIDTGRTSVLFLGDMVAEGLANLILEQFGANQVKATCIQAAHHGWAPSLISFYEALEPKEMFVDAAEYYLTSEEYANAHGVLVRWCEENSIPMHDYSSVPYSMTMK